MNHDIDRLVALEPSERVPGGADEGIRVIALGFSGRRDEARQSLDRMRLGPPGQTLQMWVSHLAAWLDRRVDDMISTLDLFAPLKIFDDPEAIFQEGWGDAAVEIQKPGIVEHSILIEFIPANCVQANQVVKEF